MTEDKYLAPEGRCFKKLCCERAERLAVAEAHVARLRLERANALHRAERKGRAELTAHVQSLEESLWYLSRAFTVAKSRSRSVQEEATLLHARLDVVSLERERLQAHVDLLEPLGELEMAASVRAEAGLASAQDELAKLKEKRSNTEKAMRAREQAARNLEVDARARVREANRGLLAEERRADAAELSLQTGVAAVTDLEIALARQRKAHKEAETNMCRLQAEVADLHERLEAEAAPKPPKAHTVNEYDALSYEGQATARHRTTKYASEFLNTMPSWRGEDWASALHRHGTPETGEYTSPLLIEVWESKELWRLRMDWARELFGMCQSHHWGLKLGLYCTLTEHMPTRQLFRVAMSGSFNYDTSTDSFKPRVLLHNPHRTTDVLHVPRILPPPSSFLPELKALTAEHRLSMSADGRIAYQDLGSLLTSLIHETLRVTQTALSDYHPDQAGHLTLRAVIQLDAARRGRRQFVECVLRNPQLASQSCFALRLLALGIRMKDDKHGAQQLLASNLVLINDLLLSREFLVEGSAASRQILR